MTPSNALCLSETLPVDKANHEPAPGLHLVPQPQSPLAAEVARGLTASPKTLSPWLFYDAEGSTLFEQITELPEYYLTRAERSIMAQHADAIVGAARGDSQQTLHILELGAGSASKTGLLLAAAVRAQGRVRYQPIDVSASALDEAARRLESELPGVEVEPHVGDYTQSYGHLARPQGPRLALYIGSSIGNFQPKDARRVLLDLRAQLLPGDSLLLGTDLRKDPAILLPAYNDAQGITASFNKNVLRRINRDLGGSFDLDSFEHEARWNGRKSRVEMHLVSQAAQRIRIAALDLEIDFRAGESIHTENSYKYTRRRVQLLLADAAFEIRTQWTDDSKRFLMTMSAVV